MADHYRQEHIINKHIVLHQETRTMLRLVVCLLLVACFVFAAVAQDDKSDTNPTSISDAIRQAIQNSIADKATDEMKGHFKVLNNTAMYYMTSEDTFSIRIALFVTLLLFIIIFALWCVCVAIKSAAKWLVNLVLLLAAACLFVLFIQLVSVNMGWHSTTSL